MIHISNTPKSKQLEQIVDHTLHSFATKQPALEIPNALTIPPQLQILMSQPGLVLLSGRPAMGNTSLALNIALCMSKYHNKTVLYFTLDTTKEMLMKKLLCIEGMVNTRRIRDLDFTAADWVRLSTAGKLIKELPLYIYDDPLLTVGEINRICSSCSHADLIIIDKLGDMQWIPGEWETPKRVKKENRILQQLSRLSKEKGIPVLCLNTLNRDVERRMCMEPDICDIRKYRKSFDYIDTALFLYREDYYALETPEDLWAFCYVRLARNNNFCRIRMRWVPEYTTFLEARFRHAE